MRRILKRGKGERERAGGARAAGRFALKDRERRRLFLIVPDATAMGLAEIRGMPVYKRSSGCQLGYGSRIAR
jgi:hypothetical protein